MGREEILKILINKTGLSMRAFAERAGIPNTTLHSMLERGIGKASVDNVIKICNALNITVEELQDMCDTAPEDIVYILKEEREGNGVSIKELANAIGISEQELNKYESCEKPINLYLFKKIANYFGFSFARFLDKYSLYDEYIPSHFTNDVDTYEKYKIAVNNDILSKNRDINLTKDETTLLANFNKLNDIGKKEANKRVAELTCVPIYANSEITATEMLEDMSSTIAAHNDDLTTNEKEEMDKRILEKINRFK